MKVTIREIEEKDCLQVAAIWRNVLDIPTATDDHFRRNHGLHCFVKTQTQVGGT